MDIKSYFFPVEEEAPALPKPMTTREILEDLDNADTDDPVIQFGTALRKRGPRRFSIDTISDIEEELTGASPSQKTPALSAAASPQPLGPTLKKKSKSTDTKANTGSGSSLYQKFKTVVETSEKTHDALHEVEAKLKAFEEEHGDFVKSLQCSSL